MLSSGEMRGKDKLQFIKNDRQLIVGFGSALVDILIHEKDEFLKKTGAVKGGMTLVDKETIERTLALSSGNASIVRGDRPATPSSESAGLAGLPDLWVSVEKGIWGN
jgi:phage-related protein